MKRKLLVCGDTISPLLYAMDVFIPLLDLRQEFRCTIDKIDLASKPDNGKVIELFFNGAKSAKDLLSPLYHLICPDVLEKKITICCLDWHTSRMAGLQGSLFHSRLARWFPCHPHGLWRVT